MAARRDIIDDLLLALAEITTANGYPIEVATIELGIRGWDEVNASERPYLGIAPDGTAPYDNETNGVYDVSMPITIVAHVDGADADTRTTELDAIEDSLFAALSADVTRGGVATATLMRSFATDEGEPARLAHGTGLMRVVVEYQRTFGLTPP